MISKEETNFRLPIEYCPDKIPLQKNLDDDLELIHTKDPSATSIYSYVFQPQTELGKKCINSWGKYFTNNISFLTDSQQLYKSYNNVIDKTLINTMLKNWNDIKNHTNFLEKYQFVEYKPIQWLNNSSSFLTLMSYYNLSSPIINLAFPILILILPFFLLKITGMPVTFQNYKAIILQHLKFHIIGKFWKNYQTTSWNQRIYYLLSLSLYFYSIYQNIISCYKFYINSKQITHYFITTSSYINYTIQKIEQFIDKTKNFKTYHQFNINLLHHKDILENFNNNIKNLPEANISVKKMLHIGTIMKNFYTFYSDPALTKTFLFSFEFHGYLDTILGINHNIMNGHIFPTKFLQNKKPIVDFKQSYYPALIKQNPIKNDINMKHNKIITGPNAAGKTTTIKSTLLNILFSQQIGYGFFSSACLTPFDFIHAYINIPDTIARDSLFQSEAKRCMEILQIIKKNKKKKHFCIFDELFSGTNPYEAISSAYSYLKYINKIKNVKFILTTHFIKLCQLFDKRKHIKNYHMETTIIQEKPHYTYCLKPGTSTIKGGICILQQLRYPRKIIKTTKNILRTL